MIKMIDRKKLVKDFKINDTILNGITEGRYKGVRALREVDGLVVFLKFVRIDDNEFKEGIIRKYYDNFSKSKELNHPNLINYYDLLLIADDQLPFDLIEVQEFIEGISLNKAINENYQVAKKLFTEIVSKLLKALSHLHSNDILHRDIKSSNLLIKYYNGILSIKLIDIEFWESPNPKALKCSPEYLAPEVHSYADYSVKSEIWALGVLIYEFCYKKLPFGSRLDGLNFEQIRYNCSNNEPELIQPIPSNIKSILMGSLHKDVMKRFNSVDDIIPLLKS